MSIERNVAFWTGFFILIIQLMLVILYAIVNTFDVSLQTILNIGLLLLVNVGVVVLISIGLTQE